MDRIDYLRWLLDRLDFSFQEYNIPFRQLIAGVMILALVSPPAAAVSTTDSILVSSPESGNPSRALDPPHLLQLIVLSQMERERQQQQSLKDDIMRR
jgi:hypothetical protein